MATVSTRNSTVWVKWEPIVVHLGVVSQRGEGMKQSSLKGNRNGTGISAHNGCS